jgi:hypothetical protein
MLKIDNWDAIIGMECNGNRITGVRQHNNMIVSGYHYVFVFKDRYKGNIVEIYLTRERKNDRYEMFVMGWRNPTGVIVSYPNLTSASTAAVWMTECLQLLDKC